MGNDSLTLINIHSYIFLPNVPSVLGAALLAAGLRPLCPDIGGGDVGRSSARKKKGWGE